MHAENFRAMCILSYIMVIVKMACNRLSFICIVWCLQLLTSVRPVPGSTAIQDHHKVSIEGDKFVVDGQPLHIMSGSLHYFRVPAVYWRDRLHKLKAAGLNSVATYVEWSFHEPEERQYSFEGDRDLAAFIKLAAEEGLHVLLRPGPYICAERDLGGLPYWLLGKYPKIRLRTADPDFVNETTIWMERLFTQISPLLFGNGGPIILVQVENEYGSLGSDVKHHHHHEKYKTRLRDVFKQHVGDKALLYTTDGFSSSKIKNGAIPETLTTIDFGPSNNSLKEYFNDLRMFMPHGPLMNSEYYLGWLTHWGDTLQVVPTDRAVHVLSDMLNQSINFNIYVFFGGTNYEFTSGATIHMSRYLPVITSYDYDAPLNESGDPTPKYFAIRDAIAKHNPRVNDIAAPTPSNKGAYGTISLRPRLSLLSSGGRLSLGKSYPGVAGSRLPTFEKLRQRAGLMLYETIVGKAKGLLKIAKPRDRVYVYVNGVRKGILSRMHDVYSVPLNTKANSIISLLVENQGRTNFGHRLHDLHDSKGILSKVTYAGNTLNGSWSVTGFPLEKLDAVRTINSSAEEALPVSRGPVLYEGSFVIPDQRKPLDTFLDPTGWGKGCIWVNGHNLGRYWPRFGPQVTLYLPGCWLRPSPALNIVQLLELKKTSVVPTVQSIHVALFDDPASNKRNDCFNMYFICTLTFAGTILCVIVN